MKKLNLLLFIAAMVITIGAKAQIVIMGTITNTTCAGLCNGTISLSVNGGVGASYTYNWNNGANTSINDSLCAGSYTVTVTDQGGNTETNTFIVSQPSPLTIWGYSISLPDSICNGSIIVNAMGGTSSYTYFWNTGENTPNAINLCDSTTYSVTVTDANGCFSDTSFYLNSVQPCSANFTWQYNASNDSIYFTDLSTGGANSWNWTFMYGTTASVQNPSFPISDTTADFQACLIIQTINGCIDSICKTISIDTSANPIIIAANNTNILCYGNCNGVITTTITGGTTPYTYAWSNGGTFPYITGLCAGIYTLTVTDSLGNTAISTSTITQPTQLLASITNYSNATCYGNNDGFATVTATGGIPPYYYLWNTSGYYTSTAINLPVGTYTVNITDVNGCNASTTVVISQPSPLATTGVIQNVTTIGGNDGSAELFTTGGVGPYNYNWTNGIHTTTALAENLSSGEYTCNISDSHACPLAYSFEICEPWDTTGGAIVATLTADQIDTCLAFTIDSFYIDNIVVDDINHIVTAYWVLTGNGASVTFPIEYEYTSGGNTIITLTLHCGTAKAITTYQSYIRIYSAIGINDVNANIYQIYPNPASDFIKINSPENKALHVEIFDLNGRKLIDKEISNESLNIKQLKSGIYNLRIGNFSYKLVKI